MAILADLVKDLPLEFDFLFSQSQAEVISGKQEGTEPGGAGRGGAWRGGAWRGWGTSKALSRCLGFSVHWISIFLSRIVLIQLLGHFYMAASRGHAYLILTALSTMLSI